MAAIAVLSRRFERTCQEAGLSLPQYRLLLYVRGRPQRAAELADQAAIKRPTLTALVDGLVEQGLLRRMAVEGDRRGIRLELTDAGLKSLRRCEESLCELLVRSSAGGDGARILDGLGELARALGLEGRG